MRLTQLFILAHCFVIQDFDKQHMFVLLQAEFEGFIPVQVETARLAFWAHRVA
jgi:hypothetical protein